MLSRKDEQFVRLCEQGAEIFSTCGKRQYMAILTNDSNHIVGVGYNGGPSGARHCKDGGCPRFLKNTISGSNYDDCIAVHAEQNAFLHSDFNARPSSLYVNGMPCFTCAKLIVNSTVKRVIIIYDDSYIQHEATMGFLADNKVEVVMANAGNKV